MRLLLASALSLLAGLGLGWLAFHADPVVQTVETHIPVVNERVVVQQAVARDAPAANALPSPEPQRAPPSAPPAPGTPPPPTAEVTRLQERIAQLEAQLETELKVRRANEGAPIRVPAGLPGRLRDEQQLVATFNAALKEAGFKGQVSNVDCSEHPCIVFGTGFGDRGDMEKLSATPAFSAYAKDSLSTFGFGRGKDNDPANRFFGVAVLPGQNGPPAEDLNKRIAFRVRQMEEVSRPPPPPK